MSEIFRFVALAAALGLAAGMLLGGVALLLSVPAHAQPRAQRPAPELDCMPVPRPAAPSPRLEI